MLCKDGDTLRVSRSSIDHLKAVACLGEDVQENFDNFLDSGAEIDLDFD